MGVIVLVTVGVGVLVGVIVGVGFLVGVIVRVGVGVGFLVGVRVLLGVIVGVTLQDFLQSSFANLSQSETSLQLELPPPENVLPFLQTVKLCLNLSPPHGFMTVNFSTEVELFLQAEDGEDVVSPKTPLLCK